MVERKRGAKLTLDIGGGRLVTLRAYQRKGDWYLQVRRYRKRRAWTLGFREAVEVLERASQRRLAEDLMGTAA